MMRVLDLFSGVGGFSLGLERTGGYETVAFCEIAEFQRGIPNAVVFTFNRTPSDEELQFLDDVMARAALMALATTEKGKDR